MSIDHVQIEGGQGVGSRVARKEDARHLHGKVVNPGPQPMSRTCPFK